MTCFIARVVLHKSNDDEDYETLHLDMEDAGYLREIRGDSGKLWEMPTAMYVRYAVSDTEAERETITAAVKVHWTKKFGVFVSEVDGSAWRGLVEIEKD